MNEAAYYKKSGYVVDAFNATVKAGEANHLNVMADPASSQGSLRVDVAIVRPYVGSTSGQFVGTQGDVIAWELVNDNVNAGFEFSSEHTWWKGMIIRGDDGQVLCDLSMQDDDHGPKLCDLRFDQRHTLLFSYNIELWKAKIFGRHSHVDNIPSSYFGPLLGKRIRFKWVSEGVANEEFVV